MGLPCYVGPTELIEIWHLPVTWMGCSVQTIDASHLDATWAAIDETRAEVVMGAQRVHVATATVVEADPSSRRGEVLLSFESASLKLARVVEQCLFASDAYMALGKPFGCRALFLIGRGLAEDWPQTVSGYSVQGVQVHAAVLPMNRTVLYKSAVLDRGGRRFALQSGPGIDPFSRTPRHYLALCLAPGDRMSAGEIVRVRGEILGLGGVEKQLREKRPRK